MRLLEGMINAYVESLITGGLLKTVGTKSRSPVNILVIMTYLFRSSEYILRNVISPEVE